MGVFFMYRYCGRSAPPSITSTDSLLTLLFVSDASLSTEGFSASYLSINATTGRWLIFKLKPLRLLMNEKDTVLQTQFPEQDLNIKSSPEIEYLKLFKTTSSIEQNPMPLWLQLHYNHFFPTSCLKPRMSHHASGRFISHFSYFQTTKTSYF